MLYCVDKEYKIIVEVYPEEYEIDTDNPMFFYTEDEEEALVKLISILESDIYQYKDALNELRNTKTSS